MGFLHGYRRRVLRAELWAGLLTLASLALAFGLVAWAGCLVVEGSGVLRQVLWAALAVGVTALLVRYWIRPWLRLRPGGVLLAREVERRLGDERLELVSAVQLGAEDVRPDRLEGTSPELIQAHLKRVATLIAGLEPESLVQPHRLRRPAVGFLILMVMSGLVWVLWPGQYAAGLESLVRSTPPKKSAMDATGHGWVGDIQLQYRPPAYTGRDDRRVEGADGAILALPGTQVTVQARADRTITSGSLRLGKDSLPLTVRDGRALSAQMVVMEAGSYRFDLVSAQGDRWRSSRGHPIHLQVDRPPEVRLTRPARDLVVRELDAVDLLLDARDDFGLDEVRLVWRIVGREEGLQRRVLKRLRGKDQRAFRQAFRWELLQLGLAAGEQVQFYVEAVDHDTVLGPKTGRSSTVTLKVFSADEHHQELMEQVQALWEKMLARLADHLEQEPAAGAERDGGLEDHSRLLDGLKALAQQTGQLGAALRQDKLAWAPLIDALGNVGRGLKQQADQLGWMLRSVSSNSSRQDAPRPVDLRTLAAYRGRRIVRQERDVLYLEDLLDLERLEDLNRIAKDLERARRRLAELMERYRRAPDEETRREIEAQIARLKQQIARLLKRQREVLKSIRDEYLNPEAIRRMMSERDVMSTLDRIQALMMEGKVEQAMAELERLRQQLQGLQRAIDSARQGFGSERYRELAKAMARVQGELNQIAEQQKRLLDRTGQLREKVIERLAKITSADMKAVFDRLRKRLSGLTARIESIGPRGLDQYSAMARDKALERARVLAKLLGVFDLASSLETAGELVGSTERLVGFLDSFERRKSDPRAEAWLESAKAAAKGAAEIFRELRRMLPAGERLLRGREADQVRKLQQGQQELGQRLAQLRSQMQKLNQKAPLFGRQMFGGLQRSGGSMRQAGSDLGRLDPRGAHPHQRAALGELQRLQEAMRKSCQKCGGGGGGGMPLPMGHGGRFGRGRDSGGPGDPSQEKVDIPDEDEYQAPEAFRKELLDGMKDPVPDDYQPQVRRYYEELVK